MKYLFASLFIVIALNISISGAALTKEAIPTVSFCELLKYPERYDQKTIQIQAVYRYGFEWSELYCLSCSELGKVWVNFDESFKSQTKPEVAQKISPNGRKGRTVNISATGKFMASERYGHMRRYKYKFVITSLEDAEILLNDSPVPAALPEEVKSRIKC